MALLTLTITKSWHSNQSNQSNQIKSNQIKSNQIKSNQIKSNQIKSNQIKSNQIKARLVLIKSSKSSHEFKMSKSNHVERLAGLACAHL
jgi:plasmid maintenance system killer protein